jgi:hypothetical protein
MLSRRNLLTGLVGIVAAPAVIRVAKLMPISVQPNQDIWDAYHDLLQRGLVEDPDVFSKRILVEYGPGDGEVTVVVEARLARQIDMMRRLDSYLGRVEFSPLRGYDALCA